MKKFHLAWFGNASPSGWRKPSGNLFDWRQADIYLEVARLCERVGDGVFDLEAGVHLHEEVLVGRSPETMNSTVPAPV